MNTRKKSVEIRECEATIDSTTLQKSVKFLEAFMLGFDVGDALAILRLDDLYVESFNVEDVKQVIHGDHLSRAIGRVAGKDGKTKFAIENATRTRIVLADRRIHILGSFQNIKIARHAVCDLILGTPPGKVYSHLRNVASRSKEQF
jgi:RNA-binding protein PNO1